MKIYTILHKEVEYDWYLGHVIVANAESEVREIAKQKAADEGPDIWESAKVECQGEFTGSATEPFILLSDFNAG